MSIFVRRTLMKNKKTIIAVTFVFLIGMALVTFFSDKFSEKKVEANRSEVTLILRAYADAQLTYFEDYKEFSSNKDELGLILDSERVIAYFSKEEIPENIMSQIKLTSMPYVKQDSFRILCLFFNNSKNPEVWTINNSLEVVHEGDVTLN